MSVENTEHIGILIEKLICECKNIQFNTPRQYEKKYYENLLKEDVDVIFKNYKNLIHVGNKNTQTDFTQCEKTISIKTTISSNKICPQNIGQISKERFIKTFFTKNILEVLNIYLENLFCCDETILFSFVDNVVYKFIKIGDISINATGIELKKPYIDWNESNNIIYKDKILAEIQLHTNRNCVKFRFNVNSIIYFIEKKFINNLVIEKIQLKNKYNFRIKKHPYSFNYIGSKLNLLDFIKNGMEEYIQKPLNNISCAVDCFAGTGVVSRMFIDNGIKSVISNDIQYFSYILTSCLTSKNIDFVKMKNIIHTLNEKQENVCGFITKNYSPNNECDRMYFTPENASRIDLIRREIEKLKHSITLEEYNCLLKILLYAVIKISNTASVYGAYLKKFKKSSTYNIHLDENILYWLLNNEGDYVCHNKDIAEFLNYINTIDADITYIDPPYTGRRYDDNYHLIETIALNDDPVVYGKTGLREKSGENATKFTSKVKVEKSFLELFGAIDSKYLFLSYNSQSILSKDKIIECLSHNWTDIKVYETEYNKFSSKKKITEYLFCCKKK